MVNIFIEISLAPQSLLFSSYSAWRKIMFLVKKVYADARKEKRNCYYVDHDAHVNGA